MGRPVGLRRTPGMCQSCPLFFPSRRSIIGAPPTTRVILRSASQRVFLSASSACSTLPTPFCSLPSTCFAAPFACWVLLPVSSPTFCWTSLLHLWQRLLLDRGSWVCSLTTRLMRVAHVTGIPTDRLSAYV